MQLELPFDLPLPRRARRPPSSRSLAAMARLARWLLTRLGRSRRPRTSVSVEWNSRLRTVLGRADGGRRTVELNPRLLDRHPDELLPTLIHELCHLAVGVRDGHGPRWRAAMIALAQPPVACHRLDVSGLEARRRRRWRWRCRHCGDLYVRSHRGARRFRCGGCGGRLVVDGEIQQA